MTERVAKTHHVIRALAPFLIVSLSMLFLIIGQRDLGMMFAVSVVVATVVILIGLRSRVLFMFFGGLVCVGVLAIMSQSFRGARLTTWTHTLGLTFDGASTRGDAYQSYQGILSLADGGLFGKGLGQSRAKWGYLPEAKNDFIFAIVGEEGGLFGAVSVLVLFGALAFFGMRTALAQVDPFMRMLAATLTLGITVQAFFNMGYVMGLLPVTGVQLPLISAGGTSAIITLVTLGMLCNCARHEPDSIASMEAHGLSWFDRIFRLPMPVSSFVHGIRRRETRRNTIHQFGPPISHQQFEKNAGQGRNVQEEYRPKNFFSTHNKPISRQRHYHDFRLSHGDTGEGSGKML